MRISPSITSRAEGQTIHKSIDLDVIGWYPCVTHYMQGKTFPSDVINSFKHVLERNNVVRLDIGGLYIEQGHPEKTPAPSEPGLREYGDLIELYLAYS